MVTLWGNVEVSGELPRPEALDRKRAVGMGTSMGLGLLKNPGHPGEAAWVGVTEPSSEVF